MKFSVKKIITFSIIGLIVIYALVFYFVNFFVPGGQELDVKVVNLIKKDAKGSAIDELSELTDHGIKTRTKFEKNKDGVEYVFDVVNDGTLDAKLKFGPIYLKTDQYFKNHVDYKLTYLDDTPVRKGDVINSGETQTMKVSITYNKPEFASQNAEFYESHTYLLYTKK